MGMRTRTRRARARRRKPGHRVGSRTRALWLCDEIRAATDRRFLGVDALLHACERAAPSRWSVPVRTWQRQRAEQRGQPLAASAQRAGRLRRVHSRGDGASARRRLRGEVAPANAGPASSAPARRARLIRASVKSTKRSRFARSRSAHRASRAVASGDRPRGSAADSSSNAASHAAVSAVHKRMSLDSSVAAAGRRGLPAGEGVS